jgi:hypothetical protein
LTVTAERTAEVARGFLDYFRCPESFAEFAIDSRIDTRQPEGYFRFGADLVCYGPASAETAAEVNDTMPDLLADVRIQGGDCVLPFDPTHVAESMRRERYVSCAPAPFAKRAIRRLYYLARPLLPVAVRRPLQARWLRGWQDHPFPRWPVDTSVDRMFERLMRVKLETSSESRIPFIWFWPDGKQCCAAMTHDVETAAGLVFTGALMDINDAHGIKSSFQLIPGARYTITDAICSEMRQRGFEVNVHDLMHDGHLFDDPQKFAAAAEQINAHGIRFGSKGFRSGALYRNQDWYGALQFSYDMSVPNCGHLDPQRGGCCTVMPYFVDDLLELPVTATQDYTLFHVLKTYKQDLWQEQIARIAAQHGLINLIVHPDYLDHREALDAYEILLRYLGFMRAEQELWITLPGEIDTWWRARREMRLETSTNGWRIVGGQANRARIAYAVLDGDGVKYSF